MEPLNPWDFRKIPGNEDASNTSMKIFQDMLLKAGLDEELAEEVKERLDEASTEKSNIVFIFTVGTQAITVVHVPEEALDGRVGPVLTRGANDEHIIAAFSGRYIKERLDLIKESAGLDSFRSESMWMDELEKFAEAVKIELAANPPQSWGRILDTEGI